MAYAQTSYNEKVGNGPYTIAQIGCFITAFCNLAEHFGITVDPPTLNNLFNQYNDYLSDPGDGKGVKDDLGWNSITSAESSIVVTGTGTGWPTTNNAIVKFFYKSTRTGEWETHFCAMADYTKQLIVDSWDGITKESGEYGTPVGYATYGSAKPQPVVTAANPAVVPPPQPTVPPPSGPTELFLPSAAGTWRVYAVGGPYSSAPVDHSIHKLVPGASPPGLTYQVLDTLAPHVYKIQTQDFGQVAIYAGPDTIAQFPAGGHGDGESQATYTAFDKPMDLVTNKEATIYNYETGDADSTLPVGTRIIAEGKAVNGDSVYFVDINSVRESKTLGIKTVDLSPYEASTADEDAGDKIPVKVASWQSTFTRFVGGPQRYIANESVDVDDINEDAVDDLLPPQELNKGTLVSVAGIFDRDGVKYYRTAKSTETDVWYGIPVTYLTKVGSDDELDQLLADLYEKPASDITPAASGGLMGRIFGKNKGAK